MANTAQSHRRHARPNSGTTPPSCFFWRVSPSSLSPLLLLHKLFNCVRLFRFFVCLPVSPLCCSGPPILAAPDGGLTVWTPPNEHRGFLSSFMLALGKGLAFLFTQVKPLCSTESKPNQETVKMSWCLQSPWPINHRPFPKSQGDTPGPRMALAAAHTESRWHMP